MTDQPGQMTWKVAGAADPALHLRRTSRDVWQPYTAFPEYAVPDPPGFSAGYATFIALLRQDWESL